MDESGGTIAADSSGAGHDGTLVNGPTFIAGRIGNALSLDGSNDYVRIDHAPELSLTDEMTMAAWVYKISNSGWDEILSKGETGQNHNYAFQMNGAELVWTTYNGGYTDVYSAVTITRNRWYHVAVTFNNATDTVKFYVDGSLRSTRTTTANPLPNTEPLFIGRCTCLCILHGRVDDVRLYNRALSDAEIAAIEAEAP
jgi:hypothetical protein